MNFKIKNKMFCVLFVAMSLFIKGVYFASISERRSETELAEPGEFPYMVAMFAVEFSYRYSSSQPFTTLYNYSYCGGSIINKNQILTAAHCFNRMCWDNESLCVDIKNMFVRAGVTDRRLTNQDRDVVMVKVHPEFTPNVLLYGRANHDIALITVDRSFNFDDKISPVPLAVQFPQPGTVCVATGWGHHETHENIADLLKKETYAVGEQIGDGIYATLDNKIVDMQCKGDSGGPLVCDGKLTGIISGGAFSGKYSSKCQFAVGISTNVVQYIPWLRENGVYL